MNVKTIFTTNTQNIYQKSIYLNSTPTTVTRPNIIVTDEDIYKVLVILIIFQLLIYCSTSQKNIINTALTG